MFEQSRSLGTNGEQNDKLDAVVHNESVIKINIYFLILLDILDYNLSRNHLVYYI